MFCVVRDNTLRTLRFSDKYLQDLDRRLLEIASREGWEGFYTFQTGEDGGMRCTLKKGWTFKVVNLLRSLPRKDWAFLVEIGRVDLPGTFGFSIPYQD